MKKIFNQKNKDFWLMTFVISSTLIILTIWIVDINNVFSAQQRNQETDNFSIFDTYDDISQEMDWDFEEFSSLLEADLQDDNIEVEEEPAVENNQVESGVSEDELRRVLMEQIESMQEEEDINNQEEEEVTLEELLLKIQELENRINSDEL